MRVELRYGHNTFKSILGKCLVLVASALFLVACDEKDIALKGDVIGFVRLLDENGSEILDRSGVMVSLSDQHTATTDASGKFEINGVPAGSYIVTYEKEGYGTYKSFNFSFAGGRKPAVLYNIYLLKLPGFSLTQFHVFPQDNLSVQVTGSITQSPGYNFTYFFSDQGGVTSSDFDYSYGYSFCCGSVTDFNHMISLSTSGFAKGQTVYMTIYASNATNKFGQYNYYDYELGKTIDPALKKITEPVAVILK